MVNNCKHCGKETTNPNFCSRSCSAKETNKTPKRKRIKKCSKCDSLAKYNSSLCEYHYEEYKKHSKEYIENLTLKDYTERESIKKLHSSSKFAHIRGFCRVWNKNMAKLPCHVCGYSKHVELAHIKPISSFPETATLKEINGPNNVIQLCPNCHWEFDNGIIVINK